MRKIAYAFLVSVSAAASLAPSTARAADVQISEEARTHFSAGVALLKDPAEPRYEEAYREFKAAYAASPSYKILGNLGLCAMKIERDAEAIWAYETYLKDAGPELTGPEREQIQRDLLTLKTGVVTVQISSNPPGATVTDVRVPITGGEVRNSYGDVAKPIDVGLRRGHHVITARLAGYVDATWEFEASGANLPPHVFAMQKEAAPERPMITERPVPTAAYVSGAVTLGLLLTGGFFGLRALQEHNDFTKLNDGFHVDEAQSKRNSGETLNVVTDVFLGGAVVGAGITTFFVLTRPSVERPLATSSWVPSSVAPTLAGAGRSGGGFTASWIF
jgi:hypothetical protein